MRRSPYSLYPDLRSNPGYTLHLTPYTLTYTLIPTLRRSRETVSRNRSCANGILRRWRKNSGAPGCRCAPARVLAAPSYFFARSTSKTSPLPLRDHSALP